MKNTGIKFLLLGLAVTLHSMLFACGGVNQPVYGGKMEYSLNPANPFLCTAVITMDFDVDEGIANDSIWVSWGDDSVTTVYATSIVEDTYASSKIGGPRIYTHVYTGTHLYAALPLGGYYLVSFQNEYRINGESNITSGGAINVPFYLMAEVTIDTTQAGRYMPLAYPPLSIAFSGLTNYSAQGLQQSTQAGDSIVYSLVTPLETVSNPVPQYQLPNEFCLANGSPSDAFTLDPVTGNITWNSPCLQGTFCYATMLTKYRHGALVSAIMREQNIYVSADYSTGVEKVLPGKLQLLPNPANNFLSGDMSDAVQSGYVQIVSTDGALVMNNIPLEGGRFNVDVAKLAAGLYFVRVESASAVLTQKFVKQ